MLNLIVIGTIVLLVGLLLWSVRGWNTAEIEKAALAKTKAAHEEKLKLLERARLKEEARQRELERYEAEKYRDDFERGTESFLPGVRGKDKGDPGPN